MPALSRYSMVLLACFPVLAAGCTERESPVDTGEPALGPALLADDTRSPPAGSNGLLPRCFWALGAQGALRSLGASALDTGDGVFPTVSTTAVPLDCRDVLRDTVECALPRGQSLSDPVTGDVYQGWWGLAPGWASAALDSNGRRYVTGCLVQRLNATGTQTPILLEGPAAAIQQDATLAAGYPVLESTVVGDLFSSTTPLTGLLPAFSVSACWESALPQSCGLLGLPLLEQRICDDVLLCGFVSLGQCSLTCVPNGPYWQCRPGLLAPLWTQTVRVRLEACP